MILKPIAYLGVPYSDPDPLIRKFRERAATQMVLELLKQNILVYSPITHNIPISRLGAPEDHQFWLNFDHGMLSKCDKLLVFKLPGWERSKGLAAEIEFAKTLGLPIEEIEPDSQFLNKISIEDNYIQKNTTLDLNHLSQLIKNIKLCTKERSWDQCHSPKNLAMNLQIEAADLAEHFVWLTETESYNLSAIDKQNIADELGGVFMTLLLLSDKLGIDLLKAASKKLENIKQKHPVDTYQNEITECV